MRTPEEPPGAAEVSAEQARQQLEKILSSRALPRGSRAGQFLAFVVEEKLAGREESIKETSLALHVFRRNSSFDSRLDSRVRVEAHSLRKRLREYYAGEGTRDEVVIELPVGGYVPEIRLRPALAVSAAPLPANRLRRPGLAGVALLITLLAALWAGFRMARPAAPEKSIAILPFKNLGGPANEGFCQGLTEDVTAQLARIPEIRVTSRTSASQAEARTADVRKIGEILGVGSVIEGSVWRQGDRVRFTAQLIETTTGYHIWSDSYEHQVRDELAAAAEVTRLMVAAVAGKLGSPAAPAAAHVPGPEARRLFWEARYLRQQATPEARAQAAERLEKAVALDPDYGDAWAALASVSLSRTFHGEGSFAELAERTRSAARQATSLDEGNTDGLVALAQMEWLQDRNWPAAEKRLRRALELNPSAAAARSWLATGLITRARFDDALRELDLAEALNPLSHVVSNDRAVALYCARRWPEAAAQARRSLTVNPGFFYARVVIGACRAAEGRLAEAIEEFRRVGAEGGEGAVRGRLGNALARAGQRAEAAVLLDALQREGGSEAAVHTAYIQTGLGDLKGALRSLALALARHETDLNYFAVDPIFDPLRTEPGFAVLRRKLGL